MMRPYLAILRDSFHAALASRVLWVAFIAIWLLLGALAPIGYREDYTTTFRGQDFHNGTRMKAMLARGLVDPQAQSSPAGHIATAMPEDLQRQLRRVGEGEEVRIRLSVLADALNELLDQRGWYDSEAWSSTLRLKERRELESVAPETLDESARRRLARLRIEAALPGVFETRAARSIILTYGGLDFPADFAVDKTQFVSLINQWVVPVIIDWLLGFALIFLGILVTASIIPDMLQPGSLHLLLSKPISRTLLLLSKFVGGCAFVFLCVLQLVVGLYLLAGFRLDIWNVRLLWCIPAAVFLFSVFYSVSVLAGLRWRSPILAIGVTVIFGTICLVVGVIGGLFDGFIKRPDQLRHLAVAGETLFATTRGGGLLRYDSQTHHWEEIFESGAMNADRALSPVPLDEDAVATAQVRGGRFNPFGSGPLDLLVLSRDQQWQAEPAMRLPTATSRLFRSGDQLLAMNTGDLAATSIKEVMISAGQPMPHSGDNETVDPSDDRPNPGAASSRENLSQETVESQGWLSKLSNMMGGPTEQFHSLLPSPMTLSPPRSVVADPAGRWLIIASRGTLSLLKPTAPTGSSQADRWELVTQRSIPGEPSEPVVLAVSGSQVLVAREEQPLRILNAENLEERQQLDFPSSLIPIQAVGLPRASDREASFVLATSDGRARLVETDGTVHMEPFGPDDVESLHVDSSDGDLYVVHDIDAVDIFDSESLSLVRQIRPELTRWRMIDRYVISPLRLVIPQTGELGETIAAIVSGKSAVAFESPTGEEEFARYEIARPVISCTVFTLVMLTVSCFYFATRDF